MTERVRELVRRWRTGWREPVVLVESLETSGALQEQRSYSGGSRYLGQPQDALDTFRQQGSVGPNYKVLRGERLRTRTLAAAARSGRGGIIESLFHLLTFGSESNEVYEVRVADLLTRRRFAGIGGDGEEGGVPFAKFTRELYRVSASAWRSPVICLAHRPESHTRYRTNPEHVTADAGSSPDDRGGLIYYGDSLLVMAYGKPSRKWR